MNTPLRLEHYSAQPMVFDPTRTYTQPDAHRRHKPRGLWVSVRGPGDWPSHLRHNTTDRESWTFAADVALVDAANIRLITTVDLIDEFHREFACGPDRYDQGIDWRRVADHYDGVIIAPHLLARRVGVECPWYYSWDCASGCIWNLAAVASVRPAEKRNRPVEGRFRPRS